MSTTTREDVIAALAVLVEVDQNLAEHQRRLVNRLGVFEGKISPYSESPVGDEDTLFRIDSAIVGQTTELLNSKLPVFKSGPRKGLVKGGLPVGMIENLQNMEKITQPKRAAKTSTTTRSTRTTSSPKATTATKGTATKSRKAKTAKKAPSESSRIFNLGASAFPEHPMYCGKKAVRFIIHEGMDETSGLAKAVEVTSAWAEGRQAANA